MLKRVATGIPGFDKLVSGGLPEGRIILLCGTPGTGKSIFCAQVLYNNAKSGKKCLYLNLEQNEGRLESQMSQFGWDSSVLEKNLKIVSVDPAEPNVVDFVLSEIQKLNYDIIALDSLDSISSGLIGEGDFGKVSMSQIAQSVLPMVIDAPIVGRLKLKKIFTAIANSKATAIVTSEKVENAPGLSRDTVSEFLSDGILVLTSTRIGPEFTRQIHVEKMRETKINPVAHSFEFGAKGITVK